MLKRMTVICECKYVTTASQVVQPLADGFPLLEYVSIRLGQSPIIAVRNIAEDAVQRLTGVNQRKLFQPFQRLPGELQEMVLCHTNLVAPNYLSWNEPFERREQYRTDSAIGTERTGYRLISDSLLICCQQCTISKEVCACSSRHAASGYSSCNCWDSPVSLFLVSKDFNQKAVKIFFSRNKFVLWEKTKRYDEEPDSTYLLDTSNILQGMLKSWAVNIRWLRFCVFEFESSDLAESSIGLQSWTTLAKVIKTRWATSIEQMTVELDFAYRSRGGMFFHGDNRDETLQSFRNIASAFQLDQNSSCYKDFFIRLSHHLVLKDWDWARWKLEKELEKQIMGVVQDHIGEHYEAARRGKYRGLKGYADEALGSQVYKMLEEEEERYLA